MPLTLVNGMSNQGKGLQPKECSAKADLICIRIRWLKPTAIEEMKRVARIPLLALALGAAACSRLQTNSNPHPRPITEVQLSPSPSPSPTSAVPNLQAELLDDENTTTASPIGKFDFKNYTYELPRGWQNPDGTADITLKNGKAAPVGGPVSEELSNEARAVAKAERRIGMSYVTTKFFDVTSDAEDEAIVVLKVETGGSAIPQLVYVFEWKGGRPELIWTFRTGDRADGGLKHIRVEHGMLIVELYGQDRFILGQIETGKITDDLEQLCCPTHFTRSSYKWNGKNFLMQGKRLTYLVTDPKAAPIENLGDKVNKPQKPSRR